MGKRRLTWVLLALLIVCVMTTLLGVSALALTGKLTFLDAAGKPLPASKGVATFILPNVVPQTLEITQGVGAWLLVILTAVTLGMEETYGTLRVMIGAGMDRTCYLAGKLGGLVVVAGVFVVAGLVVGVVSSLLIGALAHPSPSASPTAGLAMALSVGMALRTIGVLCVPIALTFCATVLSRSQVIGIAVGLGYYVFDTVAGNALDMLGIAAVTFRPLLLGRDVAAVMNLNHFGPTQALGGVPPVPTAVLALLGYGAIFVIVPWLIFRRRDITSGAV